MGIGGSDGPLRTGPWPGRAVRPTVAVGVFALAEEGEVGLNARFGFHSEVLEWKANMVKLFSVGL